MERRAFKEFLEKKAILEPPEVMGKIQPLPARKANRGFREMQVLRATQAIKVQPEVFPAHGQSAQSLSPLSQPILILY
jgi:hypothetical protein